MHPDGAAPRLILASASPRRAELLRAAGIAFDVVPAGVDERFVAGETPAAHVERLAVAKVSAVAAHRPGWPVLGADTVVVVDGDVLGKPADEAEATAMLWRLSGRTHEVLTGVALVWPAGRILTRVEVVTVEMATLGEDEVAWYVATGEGADKAGAYGVQGMASRFVTRVDGSYSAVVGLSVAVVHALLREAGLWHYPMGEVRNP